MSRIKGRAEKALKVIGKIKTGDKKKTSGGKEYPVSLDYFRIDSRYEKMLTTKLGEGKPTELDIFFYHDKPELECIERYELRDEKGKLISEGDGEEYTFWNKKTNSLEKLSRNDEKQNTFLDKMEVALISRGSLGWKPTLTLRFVIVPFNDVLGLWEFTTHAEASSIGSIIAAYDSAVEHFGTVKGIPFSLSVEKHTSQRVHTSNGKEFSPTYPVVSMVATKLKTEHFAALSGNTIGRID